MPRANAEKSLAWLRSIANKSFGIEPDFIVAANGVSNYTRDIEEYQEDLRAEIRTWFNLSDKKNRTLFHLRERHAAALRKLRARGRTIRQLQALLHGKKT